MSVLHLLASQRNIQSDVPNQELAHQLAAEENREGIREIAENLCNKNTRIQSECIKVLYEVGYINAGLVAEYTGDFLKLLKSKNNRLVWGGMIALSTVAPLTGAEIFEHVAEIQKTMKEGSVITVDAGVRTLAAVAAQSEKYAVSVLPYLFDHLATCRPKEVPQHAESIAVAVGGVFREKFRQVLETRMPDMSESQAVRLKRILKKLGE